MRTQQYWIVLTLLMLAGPGSSLTVAAEPLPPLDDLLKEYRQLGLPLPPREARLVRYVSGGNFILNGVLQPREYSLALQIKPATDKEGAVLLVGIRRWESYRSQEVAPPLTAPNDAEPESSDGLVLAIQCHSLGWDKLARRLLEKSLKDTEGSPRATLITQAWYYWEQQLSEPKSDRSVVAKRLKEIIRLDKELDTESNREVLHSLELALVPSKARPGTVEALIDDLVDYSADTGSLGLFSPEERYWRIAKLGFEAVPALIEHLDDDRLTRATMQGFNNFFPWRLRVRHIVSDLLQGMAGAGLDRDWLQRQRGEVFDQAEARKWWEKARKVGEEAYLLDHVFVPADTQEARVSPHILNVLQVKYPKQVPILYRLALDKRPELDSRMLVQAVLEGDLPVKGKLDLFRQGMKRKENRHKYSALWAIKELDRKEFTTLWIATVESFPRDVSEEYWSCPEARIASLAIEADDPRVWTTLERVAKRSALGLRMEMLNGFANPGNPRHRSERLRLLASFLEDGEIRDQASDKRFGGPGAGFMYARLEVRDFIVLQLASLLGTGFVRSSLPHGRMACKQGELIATQPHRQRGLCLNPKAGTSRPS